jgi:N-acetylmuramoyl-L-alanine amidase CwlA
LALAEPVPHATHKDWTGYTCDAQYPDARDESKGKLGRATQDRTAINQFKRRAHPRCHPPVGSISLGRPMDKSKNTRK